MASTQRRILILCKTYPSPSAKHAETSCVAGVDEHGAFVRLFPVPFRLISDDKQFKKWQWITARLEKAKGDHRPESHKVFVDTIKCDPKPLPTTNNWKERRGCLASVTVYDDFGGLDAARISNGETLGLVRPARIASLEIKEAAQRDWTDAERKKLIQLQQQADLFDDSDATSVRTLRKVPYDFHYTYECNSPSGTVSYRHKIVDWEIGALYWNVLRDHGTGWEKPFRQKLESELPAKDLMFLMGTIHRFPDHWLIVSLIYPPKQQPIEPNQGTLL